MKGGDNYERVYLYLIRIIPILNGLLINLIYDKIKTTLKFGDWKSGHNTPSDKEE